MIAGRLIGEFTALLTTGMEVPLRDLHAGSWPGPFRSRANRPTTNSSNSPTHPFDATRLKPQPSPMSTLPTPSRSTLASMRCSRRCRWRWRCSTGRWCSRRRTRGIAISRASTSRRRSAGPSTTRFRTRSPILTEQIDIAAGGVPVVSVRVPFQHRGGRRLVEATFSPLARRARRARAALRRQRHHRARRAARRPRAQRGPARVDLRRAPRLGARGGRRGRHGALERAGAAGARAGQSADAARALAARPPAHARRHDAVHARASHGARAARRARARRDARGAARCRRAGGDRGQLEPAVRSAQARARRRHGRARRHRAHAPPAARADGS